jgi:4-hydroxy-tetrahydrodipicolinate reductase
MIQIAINGAAGRMGQRLVALTDEDEQLQLTCALEQPGHPALGQDAAVLAGVAASGVTLARELDAPVQVMIDFTAPPATRQTIALCRDKNIALVIGTTGLDEADEQLINDAGRDIAILHATNFSLVVNVLNVLAARAATLLGDAYDVEILEAHHRFKKDAPSGTAITLARSICQATGRSFDDDVIFSRHGDDVPRKDRQITIQSLRIGDHVGEHTVYFAALGERLELKHVSTSRDSYVRGALHAAGWLADQPADRYTMSQVLGLSQEN